MALIRDNIFRLSVYSTCKWASTLSNRMQLHVTGVIINLQGNNRWDLGITYGFSGAWFPIDSFPDGKFLYRRYHSVLEQEKEFRF